MRNQGRGTTSTVLPPQAASARKARQFVGEVLQDWSLSEDVAETAELLTSELVSNVVLHACTSFEVSISPQADGKTVCVAVVDDSTRPVVRREAGGDAMNGRGLVLVEALASAWGVKPVGGGKAVWFKLVQDA